MAVIGVFAYRRGWHQTPYWLRLYIWCAVVSQVMLWLPFITGYWQLGGVGQIGPLMYLWIAFAWLDEILVYLGMVIGAVLLVVLLVGMLIPTKI
jgi:Na+/pantothenate symporter